MKETKHYSQSQHLFWIKVQMVLEKEQPEIGSCAWGYDHDICNILSCILYGIKVGHVEAGLRTYNLKAHFQKNLTDKQLLSSQNIILLQQKFQRESDKRGTKKYFCYWQYCN